MPETTTTRDPIAVACHFIRRAGAERLAANCVDLAGSVVSLGELADLVEEQRAGLEHQAAGMLESVREAREEAEHAAAALRADRLARGEAGDVVDALLGQCLSTIRTCLELGAGGPDGLAALEHVARIASSRYRAPATLDVLDDDAAAVLRVLERPAALALPEDLERFARLVRHARADVEGAARYREPSDHEVRAAATRIIATAARTSSSPDARESAVEGELRVLLTAARTANRYGSAKPLPPSWPHAAKGPAGGAARPAAAATVADPAPVPVRTMRDAYEGAREDLLDWKRRAQVAEDALREATAKRQDAPPVLSPRVTLLFVDLMRALSPGVSVRLLEERRRVRVKAGTPDQARAIGKALDAIATAVTAKSSEKVEGAAWPAF